MTGLTDPCFCLHVQFLHISVFKEARKANSVVRQVWLLSNDHNIILSSFHIQSHQFLAEKSSSDLSTRMEFFLCPKTLTHMNTIPTMPNPTTTTLFLLQTPLLDSECDPSTAMTTRDLGKRMEYGTKEYVRWLVPIFKETKLNQEDKKLAVEKE
jgi:hypothetical protein